MKIEEIISHGRKFAAARTKLAAIVDRIRRAQQSALDENRAALREAVNRANTIQAELAAAIAAEPGLFAKPRTLVIDGIRLGMTTRKGGITFEDAEAVVAAIKKRLPQTWDVLVRVKETPDKDAIAGLPDDKLAQIFCARQPDDPNAVVIKPTDSQVDKLVAALLEDVEPATKELIA